MEELFKLIEFIFKEFANYFACMKELFFRPSKFAEKVQITPKQVAFFILLSSIIYAALIYPVYAISPALVHTSAGWEILLDTLEQRNLQTSGKETFSMLGILEIVSTLVISIITYILVAYLFAYRRMKTVGFANSFLYYTPPVCGTLIFLHFFYLLSFKVALWEFIPNILFIIFLPILFALGIYSGVIIEIKVIKRIAEVSIWKAIAIELLAGIIFIPVFAFLNPVEFYRNAVLPEHGRDRVEMLINKSDEFFAEGDYENAVIYANNALEISPKNLNAEISVVQAYLHDFSSYFEYADYLGIFDSDTLEADSLYKYLIMESLVEKYNTLLNKLDRMATDYPDLPSVQLYVANIYCPLGECYKAEIAYEVIFQMENSLPHERYQAAAALSMFENSDSSFDDFFQNSIWKSDSFTSEMLVFIRTYAGTCMCMGFELIIEDFIYGVDQAKEVLIPANSVPNEKFDGTSIICDAEDSVAGLIEEMKEAMLWSEFSD